MYLLPYIGCILLSVSHAVWDPTWTAPFMLRLEERRYDEGRTCWLVENPGNADWQSQGAVACIDDAGRVKQHAVQTRGYSDVEMECIHQVAQAAGTPPEVVEAMERIRNWRKGTP